MLKALQHIKCITKFDNIVKKSLASVVVLVMLLGPSFALGAERTDTVQIKGGVSFGAKGEDMVPSLALRDASVRDVLYSLSEQGGFNLIVSDDVEGTLSIDLKDVTLNKVMEYIMTLTELTYYKDGNTFIVTPRSTANQRALNKLVMKSMPIKYGSSADIANILNSTVFSVDRPGGNTNAVASADPRTNSILIMGNEQDIELASRALNELDFPQQRKTFFLKYANVNDVSNNLNTITQTLFSVTLTATTAGGSSATGSSSTGSSSSTTTGSTTSGTSSSSSGTGSSSSSSSSSGTSGSSGSGTGGSSTTGNTVQVLRGGGMTFIANPSNNTVTMMGTAEQIDLVETMLYDLDVRPAQVAIQVSIIELFETRDKSFSPGLNSGSEGTASFGGWKGGMNVNGSSTTLFWDNDGGRGLPNTIALQDLGNNFRINTTFSRTKSKVLANPTLLAISGQSSTVSAYNDVYAGTRTTVVAETGIASTEPIIRQVGIALSITPDVYNDGTVALTLTPTISAPAGTASSNGEDITLTSQTSLTVGRARIKDGETLVLAGVIRENSTSGWSKIPFLSDLPIVGALFRASSTNSNDRTEIVILVTPHIIKEEGVPYFRKNWRDSLSYSQQVYEQTASSEDKTRNVMPAANNAVKNNSANIQNPVNQQQEMLQSRSLNADRSSNLPLPTFNEVLK